MGIFAMIGASMRHKNLDLTLILAIIIIYAIYSMFFSSILIIGIILALPLTFLFTGYTLIDILSHKIPFTNIQRFVFSIGLSITIDILGGIILNFFPIGLRRISWTALLGLLVMVFALIAMYLRRRSSSRETQLSLKPFRIHAYGYILVSLSILLVILSVRYSAIQEAQQPHTNFTQLWLLPSAKVNNSCNLSIGVHNFETTSTTYYITLELNNLRAHTWQSVALAPQQEWNQSISIPLTKTSTLYVKVNLYKVNQLKTPYREVHMTLQPVRAADKKTILC